METLVFIGFAAILIVCLKTYNRITKIENDLGAIKSLLERNKKETVAESAGTESISATADPSAGSEQAPVSYAASAEAPIPSVPESPRQPSATPPPVPDYIRFPEFPADSKHTALHHRQANVGGSESSSDRSGVSRSGRVSGWVSPFSSFNLEKIVGENIFSKIGILALVIGVGFFVKYAIDKDWINEVARTIMGILTGCGLWVTAYFLREKYRSFSSILAGGGFAICFVTIAVAFNYYALFSGLTTLVLFVILSVITTFMALRFDRRELAMIAVLGGYIAPLLASGGNGSLSVLFSYTALLSLAMFVITIRRNWWELPVAATLTVWAIVATACLPGDLSVSDSLSVLIFSTLFFTLFSVPLATVMKRDQAKSVLFILLVILSIANPLAYLAFALLAAERVPALIHFHGMIPLYIAAVYTSIYLAFYRTNKDNTVPSVILWIIVVFSALFIPVQFSTPHILALSFSIYALLLSAAFIITKRNMFAYASIITIIINVCYLADIFIVDIESSGNYTTLLLNGLCYVALAALFDRRWDLFCSIGSGLIYNVYGFTVNLGCALLSFAAYGLIENSAGYDYAHSSLPLIVVSLILAVAFFGRKNRYTTGFLPAFGLLAFTVFSFVFTISSTYNHLAHWTSAIILAVALTVFARRSFKNAGINSRVGNSIYYSLLGSAFLTVCVISALHNSGFSGYYSAGFSVSVIISGAALMIVGMRCHMKAIRIISLVFFGVLLIKLVGYDLWQLPMLGRTIVFILLGGVLLSLSFLYQKLRSSLFPPDEKE